MGFKASIARIRFSQHGLKKASLEAVFHIQLHQAKLGWDGIRHSPETAWAKPNAAQMTLSNGSIQLCHPRQIVLTCSETAKGSHVMLCIHPNAATSLRHACYAIFGMLLFQERRCALQKRGQPFNTLTFKKPCKKKKRNI